MKHSKRTQTQTALLLLITFTILMISSCGIHKGTSNDLTQESREVEYNTDTMATELVDIIKHGETSKYNKEKITFDKNDICDIEDSKLYFYRNSVYIQVKTYMYRFQLDEKHNVASYIKYRIEG